MTEARVRAFLALGDHPLLARVDQRHLEELVKAYLVWPGAMRAPRYGSDPVPDEARALLQFLLWTLKDLLAGTERLAKLKVSYRKRVEGTAHKELHRELVMDFARELGATPRQLAGDRKALRRWLDLDAMEDRCDEAKASMEQRMALILRRVGPLTTWIIAEDAGPRGHLQAWRELDLETHLYPLLSYPGDFRVRLEAFRALLVTLRKLPESVRAECLSDRTVMFLFREAVSKENHIWVQCEALSFFPLFKRESLPQVLSSRLLDHSGKDDLFVRRRAVQILGEYFSSLPEGPELLRATLKDPSPHVRQGAAVAAAQNLARGSLGVMKELILNDPVHQVRAAGLYALQQAFGPGSHEVTIELLMDSMGQERHPFVLRTALLVAQFVAERSSSQRFAASRDGIRTLLGAIELLHVRHENLSVRRWAAQTREVIWCRSSMDTAGLLERLRRLGAEIPAGGTRHLKDLDSLPAPVLARVLSVVAQKDYGFDLNWRGKKLHITRGPHLRFRWWRFLHEFRNPDPAKRQGHRHVVGRVFRGQIRVPSAILGELAETKVPGEPLFMASESGWRSYLPLLDEALSALECRRRKVEIYTSEGVTELVRPRALRRLWAWLSITRRFHALAALRNWREKEAAEPNAYMRALQKLGFRIRHRPFESMEGLPTRTDPAVLRFFPIVVPPMLTETWQDLQSYWYSPFGNSLTDLLVFTLAVGGWIFIRNVLRHRQLMIHRRRIPLVVGGWGTRGKSGTERLKAALFNSLGHCVVSKTTGCEAMFLYGKPFQDLREMYLFRPYDKVSIQENYAVVRMASHLGADVLLWECMALSPMLVNLLQHQWMGDDISTLTNAFPDHEDVQGPAGYDIPIVMTNFIPKDRILYTSEENMLPILEDAARERGTKLRAISWLESGLLTDDVLARFPYQEHPDNISLILAIAEDLGVDRDFALKEMADRVVADLGVLKTFPDAPIRGRWLRFTNGMSANEPFGALGNWHRVGFHTSEMATSPGEWLTVVVNNRADRVARSQVFARLIAESIAADRFFLIGGNLTGLMGYLREAFQETSGKLTLASDGRRDATRAETIFRETLKRFRIVHTPEELRARIEAMLKGLGATLSASDPDPSEAGGLSRLAQSKGLSEHLAELEKFRESWAAQLNATRDFAGKIRSGGASDADYRALITHWFMDKFQVVENYFASGEEVVSLIAAATPPGFLNRCMGMQNIKGTGLDFVYRFLAWDRCHASCAKLLDPEFEVVEAGLSELQAFDEFGVLSEDHVKAILEKCPGLPAFAEPAHREALTTLKLQFESRMVKVRENLTRSEAPRFRDRVLGVMENLFDTQDSLFRRTKAARIYRDLLTGRIARVRAVDELRRLTKRQYGGWLRGKA